MSKAYQKTTWRLIKTRPATGPWNMAVDEALLQSMKPGARPILRLYAWEPPCLSIGYAQPYGDVDPVALERHAWQVVRRPTGGRAILHTDDLTYAIIAPYDEPRVEGGVLESYQRLSAALLASLLILGLPVQTQQQTSSLPDQNGPVCFEVPSNYEITLGGKKIVGSAQARKKEGILQHGTLPLTGNLARITELLKFASFDEQLAAAEKLLHHATTVATYLNRAVSWERAATAFELGFRQSLDLELVEESLNDNELELINQLVAEKYGSDSWTQRS